MIKILLISLFFAIKLFAFDIDTNTLEKIIQENPRAYKERIILATYYEKKGNDLKALTLLQEALKIKPKDKSALKLRHLIKRQQQINEVFKEASLTKPIQQTAAQERLNSYYNDKNYQFYSNLYQALLDSGITLDTKYHINAGYIYLWDGRYQAAKDALKHVKQKNNLDVAKIGADICYYQGNYKCAARLYSSLYNSSYQLEYATKLINSYIYLGDTAKAQRLYGFISRKYPENKELLKIGQKLKEMKGKYLLTLKKAYEKNPSFTTLKAYSSALNASGDDEKNLALLHQYNQKNPTSKSLLLEAQYLTWDNKSDEALDILKSNQLNNDMQAKLMLGKIYSWNQNFEESKKYLNDVLNNTKDKETLYNTKKALAFVYMWNKESEKAKKYFSQLYKQNPHDKDVSEALMELNHDYKGLINIYKKRVASTNDPQDIKRLAELYISTKQPQQAIKYLKSYLAKDPTDLEATKELATLLINSKSYYEGFGYLEYYAAQKRDDASSILLAKQYYWNGFSKEALDVLNNLLTKNPDNKEALELKAKILKISPRFTTSNSGATIGIYFDDLGKKELQIADSLYFNQHYKDAVTYYENYLKHNPLDHETRLRYAYALENAQMYGKAEGEFFLMLWNKDSDEIHYHYAYNLMKNGKLKEAKKEFLALEKRTYKPLSKDMQTFIDNWKKSWESQNYTQYAKNYATLYTEDQMWAFKKQQLFSSLKFIAVSIYDPIYKQLKNGNYQIKFFQDYASNKNKDKGYKTLEIHCKDGEKECKIVKEKWQAGKYQKAQLLTPYIENSLKELQRLQSIPLALRSSSKKKMLLSNLKYSNTTIYI